MTNQLVSDADAKTIGFNKKKHHAKHSGAKVNKKRKTEVQSQQNAKAFAVQHTTKAARLVQRTLDYQTRKHRIPQPDRVVLAPPPIIVALVGPPKSGKSTLLRSLVKHFAHQPVNVVQGPLTVVVGKKIRLTFIECGCDINSMLDAAKIADVVLLMVNVRLGLEMYHFEFINMVQVHGLPRIIPVLNHLDTYKDSSSSRAARRKIKQRLWVDLNSKIFLLTKFIAKKYPVPESPVNEYSKPGDYMLAEVRRLARMIVVKIPHSTDWRTAHPYLLVDRLEDITDGTILAQTPDTERCVSMYGWVRGAPLPPAVTSPGIHIAGLGDLVLSNCTSQPDPCPLPSHAAGERTSRHLAERDRKIYAPMSSLGGVLFDRDATYIDLGGSHYLTNHMQRSTQSKQLKPATQTAVDAVLDSFTRSGRGLDEQLEHDHQIRILGDSSYLLAGDVQDDRNEDSGLVSQSSEVSESEPEAKEGTTLQEEEEEEDVKIFSDNLVAGFLVPAGAQLVQKPTPQARSQSSANSSHLTMKQVLDDLKWTSTNPPRINWNRAIYGTEPSQLHSAVNQNSLTTATFTGETHSAPRGVYADFAGHDFTLPIHADVSSQNWSDPDVISRIANRFTTGKWNANEDAQTLLQVDAEARAKLAAEDANNYRLASSSHIQYSHPEVDEAADSENDSECNGDPEEEEEEEEGDIFRDSTSDSGSEDGLPQNNADSLDKGSDPNAEFEQRLLRPTKRQKLAEKRKRHQALFSKLYETAAGGPEATAFYDKLVAAKEAQLAANRAVLDSLPEDAAEQLEGFQPGTYVRLEFKGIPSRFIERFNPCHPLVAGGLPNAEESKGYLKIRFRTHRWLKGVLRSNDPVTVSIGWRRYQTVGVFSKEEHNLRNRYLKYSLPHEHCFVTIYGPLVPPKTGVVLFMNSAWRPESDDSGSPTFRIAGTGGVTATNQSFQIMKKLKLVGEPFKIFSKTAFIRGMFNSSLEVSKMVGARIQTVSNVRGLIKAALTNPSTSKPGDFRATFEAPIGKSDLVFLRTFVAVELSKYYNPVLNRLCPVEGESHTSSDSQNWRLLRTLTELRQESGIKADRNPDSQYKPIHRPVYVPAPLYIPAKLVSALPFAQKPKPSRKAAREMLGGDPVKAALFADMPPPIKSATDAGVENRQDLLVRLRQLHEDYKRRQRSKMVVRVTKHQKEQSKQEQRRAQTAKQRRKSYFARQTSKPGHKITSKVQ